MKKIAFLSCRDLTGFVTDDELLAQELENVGCRVKTLDWDSYTDWSQFDLVLIRTTWDYTKRPQEFIETLEKIEKQTKLLNPMSVVKWNVHKGYLKELATKGVRIVPTHFFSWPTERPLIDSSWIGNKFILKPCISAGSLNTSIVSRSQLEDGTYTSKMLPGDWMLQPFLEEIHEGEVSLHFFGGSFSHAILKVPKAGDFRVQEEFGGSILPFEPELDLMNEAQKSMQTAPTGAFYGRVDFVKHRNQWHLMELEMVEPSLYFRSDKRAAENFRKALQEAF